MMKKIDRCPIALLLSLALVLTSCIGVRSDIVLKADGSSTMSLEYRVQKDLEGLGKLGGNRATPPVPLSEEDFRRSVQRVPGMEMKGYSEKTEGDAVVYRVSLSFSDRAGLLKFLDTLGGRAELEEEGGKGSLRLYPLGKDALPPLDEDTKALSRELFAGSSFMITLKAPGRVQSSLLGRNGGDLPLQEGWVVESGDQGIISIPMADLVSYGEPFSISFRFE